MSGVALMTRFTRTREAPSKRQGKSVDLIDRLQTYLDIGNKLFLQNYSFIPKNEELEV